MHNYVWHYWHWHTGYILHTLAYTLHTCLLVLDKQVRSHMCKKMHFKEQCLHYTQSNAFLLYILRSKIVFG